MNHAQPDLNHRHASRERPFAANITTHVQWTAQQRKTFHEATALVGAGILNDPARHISRARRVGATRRCRIDCAWRAEVGDPGLRAEIAALEQKAVRPEGAGRCVGRSHPGLRTWESASGLARQPTARRKAVAGIARAQSVSVWRFAFHLTPRFSMGLRSGPTIVTTQQS